jgi:hypothetical protein
MVVMIIPKAQALLKRNYRIVDGQSLAKGYRPKAGCELMNAKKRIG